MNEYQNYVKDLVALIKEQFEQAKRDQIGNDVFEVGVSMGIYTVLDLIKQQAVAFNISLKEIGLDNYEMEKFL